MPTFKINDAEYERLYGQPNHLFRMYFAIRRFMDFETGIAGSGKRKFTEDYFRQEMWVAPIPGRSKRVRKDFSRQEVRSALATLEEIGLIKHLGNCVFECVLADRDESIQNSSNQAATKATTIAATKKTDDNLLKNMENTKEQQPEQQPTTHMSSNPSPVSGISTNIDHTNNKHPLTIERGLEREKVSISADFARAIIRLYHETLPQLPKTVAWENWSEQRKSSLNARWEKNQSLEFWKAFFEQMKNSPHLLGQNDRGWKASLSWALKPENFNKIIEGNYLRAKPEDLW